VPDFSHHGDAPMAFCKACGQDVGNATFCPKCGVAQSVTSAPLAAPSTAGMEENVAGLLCYIFGWITGLIFLLIDKRPFVKFHAAQSIAFNLALIAISMVLWIFEIALFRLPGVGFLGLFFFPVFWLAVFALWVFLMYKAYQHEKFKLPIIGDIVEGMVK
jgi:uncharacterized membrane protein